MFIILAIISDGDSLIDIYRIPLDASYCIFN